MFTYKCFYKGKQLDVNALRSFDAQQAAAKLFKAKRAYEVKVVLAAKDDVPVLVSPASLG
jgi:hypothetical protein